MNLTQAQKDFITDLRVSCAGLPDDCWLGIMAATEDGNEDRTFFDIFEGSIKEFRVLVRFTPELETFERFAKNLAGVESNIHFWVDQRGLKEGLEGSWRGKRITPAWYNKLWVDIDPPKNRFYDVNSWHAETLQRLINYKLPPTMVVHTGRGFKGIWLLDEITDDWERITRCNKFIAKQFGDEGDHCWSADHILRIAGTWNPKLAAQKFARIELADEYRTYDIDEFEEESVDIKTEYPSEISSTVLPANIEDRIRREFGIKFLKLIKTGEGRENTPGDKTQSGNDAYIVSKLIRGQWPKELIKALMMHHEWKIGEKYRRNCNESYIERTIHNAYSHVVKTQKKFENRIEELNQNYFKAKLNGASVVCEHKIGPDGLYQFIPMSHENFSKFYRDEYISEDAGETFKPLGKYWLDSTLSRKYHQVVFDPSYCAVTDADYNLWKGFAYEPKKGDWSLFKQYLLDIICSNNQKYYEALLEWMAFCVGKLSLLPEVAVVLQGGEGIGKTFFATQLGKLFGNHFVKVVNPTQVTGNFNSHFEQAIVVLVDEAFWAGDKKGDGVLKSYITSESIEIEHKGIDRYTRKNHMRMIFASNNEWVVPAGIDARRYFVLKVSEARKQDNAYFEAIKTQLMNGGYEAMLYDLLDKAKDLPDRPLHAIVTEAQFEQKLHSCPVVSLWFKYLSEGMIAGYYEWHEAIPDGTEYADYKRTSPNGRLEPIQFGMRLKKIRGACEKTTGYNSNTGRRVHSHKLPPLTVCRKRFTEQFGVEFA